MSTVSSLSSGSMLSRFQHRFAKDLDVFKRCLFQLDSEIDAEAIPQRNDAYHRRLLKAFQASQDACRIFEEESGDAPTMILETQERFRTETDPWFRRSWIAHRSRTKPSGFAGDFEMLIKLYEQETPARGLGGYLDLCILDLPLARAVRARLAATREFLISEVAARHENLRILDIACGPCREYRDWPAPGDDRTVEIIAMDNDPKALAFIDEDVTPHLIKSMNLHTTRYNALRTRSASTTTRKFGKFDIIYSAGLCDYLPDQHLVGMLRAWRETLKDGGVLYVAFKDTERYDKTPYQWHLDWFFFQRTQQDVLNLFEAAGFDVDLIETTRDDTGIIINFMDRLPRENLVRFDIAEEASPAVAKHQRPAVMSRVDRE